MFDNLHVVLRAYEYVEWIDLILYFSLSKIRQLVFVECRQIDSQINLRIAQVPCLTFYF